LTLNDVERIQSRVSPDVKVYAHSDFVISMTPKGDAPAREGMSRIVRVIGATDDMFLAYGAKFREGVGFQLRRGLR